MSTVSEAIRCGLCGMGFDTECKKTEHVQKEHPSPNSWKTRVLGWASKMLA